MKRSTGNLGSCHRHDRQTVLPQHTLKAKRLQAGSMQTRAEASAKEIVRYCEETVRICAFLLTHDSTPARDSYCKGRRCTATWLLANEIGCDLYPEGNGKSSSDIFCSLDERISWEDIQLATGLKQPVPKLLLRFVFLVCPLPCYCFAFPCVDMFCLGRCYAHFRLVTVLALYMR